MTIHANPDKEFANEVRKAIRANNGYCPCKIDHVPENKCMCRDFLTQPSGMCHCGLYIKQENGDDNLNV